MRFALSSLVLLCIVGCERPLPAGVIHVALAADSRSSSVQPVVSVTGLSSSELADLRALSITDGTWSPIFQVTVAGVATPIVGRIVVTNGAVEFHPSFPLDPGRAYSARFNPGKMPQPRTDPVIDVILSLPGHDSTPSTTVTAIYPSTDIWPANLLRFYIEFSAPMGRASGVGLVTLLDDAGKEVEAAFLPLESDFWNGEHTRYTVFFDPGRVKEGILPNRQMGRPLVQGRKYAINVSADWRDAQGRLLASPYRREFFAGAPMTQPIALSAWKITAPHATSRDPLVVTFPSPLDHGLLQRAIGVGGAAGEAIDGDIRTADAERAWIFTPRAAWKAGSYQLVVFAILEDPCGNKINRAFEVDTRRQTSAIVEADKYKLPFTVDR